MMRVKSKTRFMASSCDVSRSPSSLPLFVLITRDASGDAFSIWHQPQHWHGSTARPGFGPNTHGQTGSVSATRPQPADGMLATRCRITALGKAGRQPSLECRVRCWGYDGDAFFNGD